MAHKNTGRILLVDGQQSWLKFAESVLRNASFKVVTASNLHEAQQSLLASRDEFSLILVDFNSATEDPTTLRAIGRKASGQKRPIVVLFPIEMTPSNMSSMFRLGIYDCANKQYNERGLLNLVAVELADYQGASGRVLPLERAPRQAPLCWGNVDELVAAMS